MSLGWPAPAHRSGVGGRGPRRRHPWGSAAATSVLVQAGGLHGPALAAALPEGAGFGGVLQLLGNAWEWTASRFGPYPGFEPDMYEDYSRKGFGTRRVLRGGSWATSARLLWATLRNFYPPARRDAFAGFRTCAP